MNSTTSMLSFYQCLNIFFSFAVSLEHFYIHIEKLVLQISFEKPCNNFYRYKYGQHLPLWFLYQCRLTHNHLLLHEILQFYEGFHNNHTVCHFNTGKKSTAHHNLLFVPRFCFLSLVPPKTFSYGNVIIKAKSCVLDLFSANKAIEQGGCFSAIHTMTLDYKVISEPGLEHPILDLK